MNAMASTSRRVSYAGKRNHTANPIAPMTARSHKSNAAMIEVIRLNILVTQWDSATVVLIH